MSTETTTTEKPTIQERRETLKKDSVKAREIQENERPECTINEILIEDFYKDEENQEFNTFLQWKKLGYKVKKGALAFAVWGKPKKIGEQPKEGEEPDEEQDEFYPLCFLFSNAQVELFKKENE